ncbi:hypothetical protein PQX77_021432, partial [Marasmius sp. AFHP31]
MRHFTFSPPHLATSIDVCQSSGILSDFSHYNRFLKTQAGVSTWMNFGCTFWMGLLPFAQASRIISFLSATSRDMRMSSGFLSRPTVEPTGSLAC